VLIYMNLLFRHPYARQSMTSTHADATRNVAMGERALFIEHPTDHSNRVKLANVPPA